MRMDRITPDTEFPFDLVQPGQQWVWDPLDWQDKYPSLTIGQAQGAALHDRGIIKSQLAKRGIETKGTCLRNQLRPYKSFGVPDGRFRTVYYLTIC